MLIVIAHVKANQIDRAVVTERLLIEIVRIMLLNPTRADRVQSDREEKRKHEIEEARPAAEINHRDIVGDRRDQVRDKPPVAHRDRFQARRTRQLEKWKE